MGESVEDLDFKPLPVETIWALTAPLRVYHRPKFIGLDNIDAKRPTLLVGNHTIYGLLDIPLMAAAIYRERGVVIRGLGDRVHFQVPGWGELLKSFGAVVGTRETCAQLMRAGAHILVYPGGGREVAKRKGEAYHLIWKERTGFARLAIEHGYPITPFASVGPEECYDIIVDGDDIMKSPLGTFLERSGIAEKFLRGGDAIMPLARGLGFTMLPRPERFYFSFGPPIDTERFAGRHEDTDALRQLRDEVRDEVLAHIAKLLALREKDPKRHLLASVLPTLG